MTAQRRGMFTGQQWAVALGAALIVASIAFALWRPEPVVEKPIDVVFGAYAGPVLETVEPDHLVRVTIHEGHAGAVWFQVRLLTTDIQPASVEGEPQIDLTNLSDGHSAEDVRLEAMDGETSAWKISDPGIDQSGWWRLRIAVPDGTRGECTFLMPDPNLTSSDAVPAEESDPEAMSLLNGAVSQMNSWTSVRWWEWLSGGNGSIIQARFSVTTPEGNDRPDSFENRSLYTAIVLPLPSSGEIPRPQVAHQRTVSIGDEAWQVRDGGTPEATSAVQYTRLAQYGYTYEDPQHVQMGVREEIQGRDAQFVSFYVPERAGQAEAWFGFWIDVETGGVMQLQMVAENHYMEWIYYDVNEPFVIEQPGD